MNNGEIKVYSSSWCLDCRRAKQLLDLQGIPYQAIDIEGDPKAAEVVKALNDGKRRVPTIVIDGRYYGNPPLSELAELVAVS